MVAIVVLTSIVQPSKSSEGKVAK